jgi:predicted HTH transcriptional regulator
MSGNLALGASEAYPSVIPFPIESLIRLESARLELKATGSDPSIDQAIRTICAFANDQEAVNGGYVIFGVEELEGVPQLPPKGIAPNTLDKLQRTRFERCRAITPDYAPIMEVVRYQNALLLVVWCRASDSRPHFLKDKDDKYKGCWVRSGNVTNKIDGEKLTRFVKETATIPFDDRPNQRYTSDVIDAEFYLRRAIQLPTSEEGGRWAWCYHDLAKVLCWLGKPKTDILEANQAAKALLPNATEFHQWETAYLSSGRCK